MSGAVSPTRLVLVDDHPTVIVGLRSILSAQNDFVVSAVARTASGAHAAVKDGRAEIAILDLALPDADGLPWVAKLMSEFPKLKVILHTINGEQEILRNALQMQVSGYILKSSDPDFIAYAIRAVRAGGTYIDPSMMSRALERGLATRPGQSAEPAPAKISKRELETLRLTAMGYGIKEIAEELKVSAKSIETYKLRAAAKLGLKSRSAIVRHAIASGWFSTLE